MDQSKSNSTNESIQLAAPKRTFSLEFFVGIFTLAGVAAAGYLAIGLAGLDIGVSNKYELNAEFDNIAGLKYGASVEIAGVPIGEVTKISLKDPAALVTMRIDNAFKIKDDDIFSIRTKGIIGDRYVKISRGGSDKYIEPGGTITENTESVIDIEDVIGKVVHSLGGGDDEDNSAKTKDGEQK